MGLFSKLLKKWQNKDNRDSSVIESEEFNNMVEDLVCSNGSIKEYWLHNFYLESSPEYIKVIDEVMKEVYTRFAKEHMAEAEARLNEQDDISDIEYYQEEKQKLDKAKKLIIADPEKAAELYMMMGSCHELWYLQKNILLEKYGITWYSPAEVNPHTIYD